MTIHNHRIVVDADVARSSGLTEHPISSSCRRMLELIRDNDHKLVACKQLREEWKKHASNYSVSWFASMIARKQVCFVTHDNEIKRQIEASSAEENIKTIALKDSHIVDAAHKEGKFIASRDENAKQAFLSIKEIKTKINNIAWINPTADLSNAASILQEGGDINPLRMTAK